MTSEHASVERPRRVAVIDVGSNSARMVVFEVHPDGYLDVVEDDREPLRLARALRDSPGLGRDAIERTLRALADFHAVALGADADMTYAVATAAVRDAEDARTLIDRARVEIGIDVQVIDGEREAEFAFLGGVHDLPVLHGIVMDVGGGSMELARFRDRRLSGTWTLPLGSLRLSDTFLRTDPPTEREMKHLRLEVRERLEEVAVPPLAVDERLVGIGGTIRNLAKIEQRHAQYPLPLLHGYSVSVERLGALASDIASRKASRRPRISGLNPDRADSIAGGALAVHAAAAWLGAAELTISSRGLREGVALDVIGAPVPSPRQVRSVSLATLARRFNTWDPASGARRAEIASRLQEALLPEARVELHEMLEHAATILDAGRAIDYYHRFEHAAGVVTTGDLAGFSHEDLGLLSAVLRQADDDTRLGPYRSLLAEADRRPVLQAATVLALADEVNRRIPPGRPAALSCGWRSRGFLLAGPFPPGWRPRGVGERFHRVFGRTLLVMSHPSGGALPPGSGRAFERNLAP
jgi:exopolyphosphatase/guanosine-5'-triphosphate,3'-diphosphate pyrophosphatase